MSAQDPRKLTEQLLDAARAERPGEAGKQAAKAAIEGGVAPREAPPKNAPWTQWLRRGLGAALLLGLGLFALQAFRAGERVTPAPVQPPQPLPPPQPKTPEPPPEPERLPSPLVEAPVVVDAGVPAPKKAPVVAREEDDDPLARELALVEAARASLKTNPAVALERVTEHAKRFPRGALVQEARLIRLEALLKLNRRAEAERLAVELRGNGASALLKERVQRLLDGDAQ